MTEAELKLEMIRWISSLQGDKLISFYQNIQSKWMVSTSKEVALEQGYKEMAEDTKREQEAHEWIENSC